ncbi:4-galactosyl-N-acetylglucosaminide 3-alpha-L-fucosyltransferase 9-like isoform 2-T2 [Polymixia lowei]
MLIWFWPEDYKFDFGDCRKFFDIDGCRLTDDRSLYSKADEVLIFHKTIKDDLSNLPNSPRPGVQRWIWMNLEPPANTRKINGIDNLFNLTLNFRQDADIPMHWQLTVSKVPNKMFEVPKKEKLVCWIPHDSDPKNGPGYNYYKELAKHINVDVYSKSFASFFKQEDEFSIISSCKFYLAFEDFIYRDYITENLNGPLAVGTVPVVLGPPRQNYEDFIPGDSFIHVNDFPDAKSLADFLLSLGKDSDAYMQKFQWRGHLSAKRHFPEKNLKYLKAICLACDYVGRNKEYRVIPSLNKWYFG